MSPPKLKMRTEKKITNDDKMTSFTFSSVFINNLKG
jgi:hypothetical protein